METSVNALRQQVYRQTSFSWPEIKIGLHPCEEKLIKQPRTIGTESSLCHYLDSLLKALRLWQKCNGRLHVSEPAQDPDEIFWLAQAADRENPAAFAHAILRANSLSVKVWQIASQLYGFSYTVGDITFNLVAQPSRHGFYGINIAVRALINEALNPLETWEAQAKLGTFHSPLYGHHLFRRDKYNLADQQNDFTTEQYLGLGWASIADYPLLKAQRKLVFIHCLQEDLFFVHETQRQRTRSAAHRKTAEKLKLWKHIAMAVIEDLAHKSGCIGIISKARGESFYPHLYDNMFSKRVSGTGQPLYRCLLANDPALAEWQNILDDSAQYWFFPFIDE